MTKAFYTGHLFPCPHGIHPAHISPVPACWMLRCGLWLQLSQLHEETYKWDTLAWHGDEVHTCP